MCVCVCVCVCVLKTLHYRLTMDLIHVPVATLSSLALRFASADGSLSAL